MFKKQNSSFSKSISANVSGKSTGFCSFQVQISQPNVERNNNLSSCLVMAGGGKKLFQNSKIIFRTTLKFSN